MFLLQIKEFLDTICEQIKYKEVRNQIAEEMENHINEKKEEYIENGIEESQAEQKAIIQMGDAEEIGKALNKVHRPKLDWKLLLIIAVTLCFGFLVAIIRDNNFLINDQGTNSIFKYITFFILGLCVGFIIYFFDYRKIYKYSNYIYILASIVIIWALNFGVFINGVPYIYIGNVTIAPSDIVIPLYILAFIGFLQDFDTKKKLEIKILEKQTINLRMVKIITLSIISLILLLAIPSFTSAFIVGVAYLIISTVKLVKSNKQLKDVVALWAIPIVCGIILLTIYTGGNYHLDRLTASFNPEIDSQGSGWVGMRQKEVLNNAKMFGEAQNIDQMFELFDEGTNYAFISILAHYGWIISIEMVIVVILLNLKLLMNITKVKDIYGKLIIVGISTIFILQTICNLLMNLNLGIKADFSMPLVSYGGANLIVNMGLLALVLSIYRRKDINVQKKTVTCETVSIK